MPAKNWKIAAAAVYALLPAACMDPVANSGRAVSSRTPDATIVVKGVT